MLNMAAIKEELSDKDELKNDLERLTELIQDIPDKEYAMDVATIMEARIKNQPGLFVERALLRHAKQVESLPKDVRDIIDKWYRIPDLLMAQLMNGTLGKSLPRHVSKKVPHESQ